MTLTVLARVNMSANAKSMIVKIRNMHTIAKCILKHSKYLTKLQTIYYSLERLSS